MVTEWLHSLAIEGRARSTILVARRAARELYAGGDKQLAQLPLETPDKATTQRVVITSAVLKAMRAGTEQRAGLDLRRGVRDHAMFLLGFYGGVASAGIINMDWADATFHTDSLLVTTTNRAGSVLQIRIPGGGDPELCPVAALRRWRDVAGTTHPGTPMFFLVQHRRRHATRLGVHAPKRALHRCLRDAGFGTSGVDWCSLRWGFAAEAMAAGVSEMALLDHLRVEDRRLLAIIRTCADRLRSQNALEG